MSKEIIPKKQFLEVLNTIKSVREKAYKQVNASLIQLYWDIGKYVSQKVEKENWGKSIVQELSEYIQKNEPGIKGFTARNIWRMKQFYETYKGDEKLSSLRAEISWTHNRRIKNLKGSNIYNNDIIDICSTPSGSYVSHDTICYKYANPSDCFGKN